MAKESKADVEKAFTAGFQDKDFEVGAEIIEQKVVALESVATPTESTDAIVEKDTSTEDLAPAADEWEGIPDGMRTRFETMEASLKKATDIAKSASGRANKLQSTLDKQSKAPIAIAKPTKDQIIEALTNKDKRNELREDFEGFASALDEMDQSFSVAVGSAIDGMRNDIRQETLNMNNESMRELEVKRSLDIKHPGWETTVKDKDFKSWVYEGGPSEQEIVHYESMLIQATSAIPSNYPAASKLANDYYRTLLDNNPVWANEKGSLYGNSSGDAAISLLDNFKLSHSSEEVAPQVVPQVAATVNKNKQRLEANIVPTSGNGRLVPQSDAVDVEKAFSEGFNGSTYN